MSLLLLLNQPPPYHEQLLRAAEKFRDERHYGVSIIAAHMACEIRAEQVMNAALRLRGFDDSKAVADAVMTVAGGNVATNKRVRRLFDSLTGEDIRQQPFWRAFVQSREVRNAAVHSEKERSHEEAVVACSTSGQVLRYLKTVAKRLHDEAKARQVGP